MNSWKSCSHWHNFLTERSVREEECQAVASAVDKRDRYASADRLELGGRLLGAANHQWIGDIVFFDRQVIAFTSLNTRAVIGDGDEMAN